MNDIDFVRQNTKELPLGPLIMEVLLPRSFAEIPAEGIVFKTFQSRVSDSPRNKRETSE